MNKLKTAIRTFAQHLLITLQFFSRNGLANHAAAGAYGFLLSAAPMLLIASFFMIRAFRAAPETAVALLQNIPFLNSVFDEYWPALEFLISAPPGIPTLIFMLSILWAGRVFAVSLHRGLKVVFSGTKKRNPVKDNMVTLAIEFVILAVMLVIILGSRMALRLYGAAGFFQDTTFQHFLASLLGKQPLRLVVLGVLLYFAYLLIPANPPSRLSAFWGSVFCIGVYGIAAMLLGILLRQPMYNFLYGTLGDLIILLVSVYFFFLFFFLGAQFASVTNSFEALFFLRLRETKIGAAESGNTLVPKLAQRLFYSTDGRLEKYHRFYPKGEIILSKGDEGNDVFFLMEGEVEVLIPSETSDSINTATILKPGVFLGEMSYLLSESRSATIMARTDVSALALPAHLFGTILDSDVNLDRSIIENLSRRIKKSNERVMRQ
ncbi:MAG: YihY/virulence factor BrkB family protein [Treponema sp.]|nr:YihY/virulence factor BrkB family protein [Treponema sp.]